MDDYSSTMHTTNFGSVDEIAAFFMVIFWIFVIAFAVSYLITIYPKYYMFKEAGLSDPWLAFIPIVSDIKFFNLAGKSGLWYLGYIMVNFIPGIGGIVSMAMLCYIYWEVGSRFGLGTFGRILSWFLGYLVFWYIALARKPYDGTNNPYSGVNFARQTEDNWYQPNENRYQQPGCNPEFTSKNKNNDPWN